MSFSLTLDKNPYKIDVSKNVKLLRKHSIKEELSWEKLLLLHPEKVE